MGLERVNCSCLPGRGQDKVERCTKTRCTCMTSSPCSESFSTKSGVSPSSVVLSYLDTASSSAPPPHATADTANMLFLAALVVLVQLAVAVPTSNTKNARRLAVHLTNAITGDCDSLVEESAWVITNLASFQAYPSANSISYL